MMSKRCYLVGTTNVLTSCVEHLLSENWEVLGIISSDVTVLDWAKKKNIKTFLDIVSFYENVERPFDYLFSIINDFLLKHSIIKLPSVFAINYHYSLLPRYAGPHATSWAIINGEKKHGISWHVIDSGIDTGDILIQESIDIGENETATSLNIKCASLAISSFKTLIKRLDNNSYNITPQDLSNRTLYLSTDIPKNAGFIDFKDSSKNIFSLFRGLNFGTYDNPITTCKLIINNNIFILTKILPASSKSTQLPGTIIEINDGFVTLATANYNIDIIEAANLRNLKKKPFPKIIKELGLKKNDIIQTSVQTFQKLTSLVKLAKQNERYWIKNLKSYQQHPLLITGNTDIHPYNYDKIDIAINYSHKNNISKIIASAIVYLYRISSEETISIDINISPYIKDPIEGQIISQFKPLVLKIDKTSSLSDFINKIQHLLEKYNSYYCNDLFYRYPKLPQINKDDKIAIYYSSSSEDSISDLSNENYNILIFISNTLNKLTIRYKTNSRSEKIQNTFIFALCDGIQTILNFSDDNTPNYTLRNLPILSEKEYKKIIYEWNDTESPYPKDKLIHQLFEEQVEKTSDNIAAVFENTQLTYRELNERANQLAYAIRTKYKEHCGNELKSDSLIGIYINRSLEMLIGILGILKSGAAYVPFDPIEPEERLKFKISDSNCKIILTTSGSISTLLLSIKTKILLISIDEHQKEISNFPQNNPSRINKSTNLAYVIYTSGSTGQPKGVMNYHYSLANRLFWMKNHYNFNEKDIVLQKTPYSFDVSIWELLLPGICGAQVVFIKPGSHKIPQEILNIIENKKITKLHFIPSMLEAFLSIAIEETTDKLKSVNAVFCSGEALSALICHKFKKLYPWIKLNNLYGPTEAAIDVTFYDDIKVEDKIIPIGKPISNTSIYILSPDMHPVPLGIPGELYIGGDGLARGYLNRPELTSERFIPNPFTSNEDKLENRNLNLYKTGDIARWLSDGNIEYIGRNDFQVKIRGFRIELGEIENVLSSYKGIKQCIITAYENNNQKQITAYYVPNIKQDEDNTKKNTYISSWQNLYDSTYSSSSENLTLDFSGWNSSFTGNPIPINEMLEWRETTIQRIKNLAPRNVLEIGCGSGLLLYPLFSECSNYHGIDFSAIIISKLRIDLNQKGAKNVYLEVAAADKIDTLKIFDNDSSLDTIIINSVIQYFPNIMYLKEVLFKAIKIIPSEGTIFIGDVRDYRLLKEFHYAVAMYKILSECNETDSLLKLTSKVENNIKREKELLISPEFFIDLAENLSEISGAEFLPKRGTSINEMNCFRYDVILHINKQFPASSATLDWIDFSINLDIRKILRNKKNCIAIKNYPNKRVKGICSFTAIVDSVNKSKLKEKYLELNKDNESWYSIEDLHALAEEFEYNLLTSISLSDKSAYNLIFYKESPEKIKRSLWESSNKIQLKNDFSNNPVNSFIQQQLSKEDIRKYLYSRLPDYMVPSYFIELDSIPLTANGKTDIKALPKPDILHDVEENYMAPRSEAEWIIHNIWCEILGLEKIGIYDNFFHIGGHSLKATQVSSRIQKILNKKCPIKLIFDFPEISKLAEKLIKGAESYNIIIPKTSNDKKNYELSFAQSRLWFLDQYEGEGTTNNYNIPLVLRLTGELNINAFERALDQLLARHESLRTLFKKDTLGNAYQYILPLKQCKIFHGLEQIKEDRAKDIISYEVNYKFRLSEELLIRIRILKFVNKDEYLLIIVQHHIISDGWSMNIFVKEFNQFYNTEITGTKTDIPNLDIQYKDYAVWQRKYLSGDILKRELCYWENKLKEYEDLRLPTDKIRPAIQTYNGSRINFIIDKELVHKLKQIAFRTDSTLYMVLLSAFSILLSKYSNQDDIVIGTPIANRQYHQVENLMGFFVNTLALRIKTAGLNIKELITQIKLTTLEAYEHQSLPFEYLVDALGVDRNQSKSPVFQVMFVFQNVSDNIDLKFKGINVTKEPFNYDISKLDLGLSLSEKKDNCLYGEFEFNTDLYYPETINRMTGHYRKILESLIESLHQNINNILLLTKKEYEEIINCWNNTESPYPKDKLIHQLFEEQVEKTPDNIAVVFENTQLTYRELNERANQLAYAIRTKYKEHCGNELKSDSLIGIYINRSLEMLIGILGILKSGAAYVPFDPIEPEERLKFKISDSNCKIILTTSDSISTLLLSIKTKILLISIDEHQKEISNSPKNNPSNINKSTDLAYVIYTSGSTGQPKGVMIEHCSVINLTVNLIKAYDIRSGYIISQFISISFDASVAEIFPTLLSGSLLFIISDNARKDVVQLSLLFRKIDIACIPIELLNNLEYSNSSLLKTVITGGDVCKQEVLETWSVNNRMINAYGPTESTVCSSQHIFKKGDLNRNIGKPLDNVTLYVLSDTLELLPIGIPGELYIGGEGLARGYLNRPELTLEKFISNPFASNSDKTRCRNLRLYKTGDIVRWLPDSNIEYIGRKDFQVKIRGFRIELGEIESNLLVHPAINQAVVTVWGKTHLNDSELQIVESANKKFITVKYLVAHYSKKTKQVLVKEELRDYLASKLPDFMIPSYYVELDTMPINTSGKIDRKILPPPELKTDNKNYIPPRNEIEGIVCQIWAELLGLEKIGIKDDFFKSGGDSILSIQLISRMSKAGIVCRVKDIFEHKTIECLLNAVGTIKTSEIKAEQGILSGKFSLLPIQHWFFDKQLPEISYWNQAFLIKVSELNIDKLKKIIPKLLSYHDVLRLTFPNKKEQEYHKKIISPELKILNRNKLSENEIFSILTDWQSNFDIEMGPLWSIGYIYGYNDKSARIFFSAHHLIIDVVSWRILAENMNDLYNGKKLNEKSSSYRQWVNTVKNYTKLHKKEITYWEKIISKQIDYAEFSHKKTDFREVKFDRDITSKLLYKSNNAYHTEINDILLTALAYALKDWHGNNVSYITLEGHGREEISKKIDTSHTIGWFTIAYPVKLEIRNSISESIKLIKETLRSIPNKGLGYGAFKYYGKSKQLKTHKIPLISFNYLGQFDNVNDNWHITNEPSGMGFHKNNKDENIISINGLISEGILKFSISSKLSRKAKLGINFKNHLINIVNHCISKKKTEYTPSDFASHNKKNIIPHLNLNKGVLSYQEEKLWFLNKVHKKIFNLYNMSFALKLTGPLQINVIEKSINNLIERHKILRTIFCENSEKQAYQKVLDIENNRFISNIEEWNEKDILRILSEEINYIFDLDKPLVRIKIFKIKNKLHEYILLFSQHHMISDGWSIGVFFKELSILYNNKINKSNCILPDLPIDYIDYSIWQRNRIIDSEQKNALSYWQEKLHNDESFFYKNTPLNGAIANFSINKTLLDRLEKLAAKEGHTLYIILLTALNVLINKYTGKKGVLLGSPNVGRDDQSLERVMGFFANTLLLYNEIEVGESIKDLLIKTGKNYIDELKHSDMSQLYMLDRLKKGLNYKFAFLYSLPGKVSSSLSLEHIRVSNIDIERKKEFHNIFAFLVTKYPDKLSCSIEYCIDLFDKSIIKNMIEEYENILKTI